MTVVTAAATYVQVTREDLESWLNSIGYQGKWSRDGKTQGVYLLKLAPSVAVKLSSTIGSRDDAMGKGQASMQLSLISTVTGRVLNKKAQGQSHFKRTLNWKKTWEGGVDTMKKAYLASSDFYDAIALIEDRDAYKDDLLRRIEKLPGWDNNGDLLTFYRKVERGGVLMLRELDIVEEIERRPPPAPKAPDPQRIESTPDVKGEGFTYKGPQEMKNLRMDALRKLWVLAKRQNNKWVMEFAQDIATKFVDQDRRLSGPQLRVVADKLKAFQIPDLDGNPAFELF